MQRTFLLPVGLTVLAITQNRGQTGMHLAQSSPQHPGSSSLLVIQVHGSKITTREERVANGKILVNQWSNKHSFRN
jgi:hypothetical protein